MKIIITEEQLNRIINEDQGFKKMGQGNYGSVFLKNDKEKLKEFIKKFVKYGYKKNTMFRIEAGTCKT